MTEFDYTHVTPEDLLRAANLAAEAIRFLNHGTHPSSAALRYPADVDAILVALDELGQRLPQLLDQLGAWEASECKAGRLRVSVPGAHSPSTETVAVAALRQYLGEATTGIGVFRRGVHDARQITAALAPAGSGEEPKP